MNYFDILFAKKMSGGGGGGDITVEPITITTNGTTTAPEGKAYSPVTVAVEGYKKQSYEASDIITFNDGVDLPMLSCVANIEAVQDLHGQTSPYPAGGGKNKLPLVLANIKSVNGEGTWSDNSYTVSNVTFTVKIDNDGNIIKIDTAGTSTAQVEFILASNKTYASGDYILSGCPSDGSISSYWMTAGVGLDDVGEGFQFTSDGSTPHTIKILCRGNVDMSSLHFYPMIRFASVTDPTFAPYSNICPITGWTGCNLTVVDAQTSPTVSNVYNVTWSSQGTIYGGYVDLCSGVLTATHFKKTFNGTENWNINTTNPTPAYFYSSIFDAVTTAYPEIMVNEFKPIYSVDDIADNTAWVIYRQLHIRVGTDIAPSGLSADGVTELKTWLSSNPIDLVCPLATPQTYQLTAQQVKTLLGANNIFADCGKVAAEVWKSL